MSSRATFISLLFLMGFAGVASLYFVPLETLVPEGEIDLPPRLLKLVLLIQPALLTALAIVLGVFLGPKIGLDAPILRAITSKTSIGKTLKTQALPAVIVGVGTAIILLVYGQLTDPYFSQTEGGIFAKVQALDPPLITKILYGGIVEELMMRWGVMSLAIWLIWRLKGAQGLPSAKIIWTGIGIAALLFAAGHLPVLFGITDQPPVWLISLVIAGNAIPGIGFGWLYYRFGLEAAMIAHALAHIITTIAISF